MSSPQAKDGLVKFSITLEKELVDELIEAQSITRIFNRSAFIRLALIEKIQRIKGGEPHIT